MPQISLFLNHSVSYGQAIYVVFDFDNWDLKLAKRLTYVKEGQWGSLIKINQDQFEYKYIIGDFDNLLNNTINWEEGPNRKCKIREMINFKKIYDKWNARSLTLKLEGIPNQEALVVVYGECKDLSVPKMMKIQNSKLNSYNYRIRLQVNVDELYKELNFQYYMIMIKKGIIREFVSKQFQIKVANEQFEIMKQIELTQIG